MSKYSFDRITPVDFESMAQALLEKTYRVGGNLIQFGPGADGGREATWTQPVTHPDYHRPSNEQSDIPKEWVFQVKYHDIGQRGWFAARDAAVMDLDKELDKIFNKHNVPCHAYVMITNVPFTGVRDLGTRDKISAIAQEWKGRIPEIFVWDAADISRLLDANESVRTAYLDTILPGDIIKAIYKGATFHEDRTKSALRAYLQFVTEREGLARAEEAGDEPGLPLVEVFIDLTMAPSTNETVAERILLEHRIKSTVIRRRAPSTNETVAETRFLPEDITKTSSSFALLIANNEKTLLLGGPGLGKSTLTQFVAIYHATRLIDPDYSRKLASRLKLPEGFTPENLDAHCPLRFPFRIELRRYARWMAEEQKNERSGEIARYIVEKLVNPNASSDLTMYDVFALASSDPILLILDGLDEVPHPEVRKQILENLNVFNRRVQAEKNSDIQLLFSSRPKGYSDEFSIFQPVTWEINNLDRTDFNDYCDLWIDKRIRDATEKSEARNRIDRGMQSEAVQRLAQSLLQATVMLTIVRRKNEIPHQRHALYAKYVAVIFDREKEKSQIVRDHEIVLNRLHERVGFELHRKMEQTNVEALDAASFRSYVLNVLEEYSGDDIGQKKIREVADDIITAATDRLCLLAGKGKDQADIDFVVQSYREYFAAVYLCNHPDANPDRVFQALVRRGGYWANVLQFYVAQASANQQMRWVTDADGGNIEAKTIDDTVNLTRTRRALINVLPEFNSQRKSDFDRVLRIIFHSNTRWTWLNQSFVLDLLRVLRSGSAHKTLLEIFKDLTITDAGALAVELWMLNGLASNDAAERAKISAAIESFLDQDNAGPVALAIALENENMIDLTKCNISTYHKPGVVMRSTLSPNLFARQSTEKQCELLLSGFSPAKQRMAPICLAACMEEVLAATSAVKNFSGIEAYKLSPYLSRSNETVTALSEIRDSIPSIDNQSVAYFHALLCAAMDPLNQDLDVQAREMRYLLKKEHIRIWNPDNILGPSSDAFSSPEEWKTFKKELTDINNTEPHWLLNPQDLPDLDSTWIAFLFHAEEWPLLMEMKLLSRTDYANLKKSPFGKLFSMPSIPLNILQEMDSRLFAKYKVPLRKVLQTTLQIAENKGIDRIGGGWILVAWLNHAAVATMTKKEGESLLLRALALPPLPSSWVAALLRLGFEACVDIDLLLQLLGHGREANIPFIMPKADLNNWGNDIVAALLALNHPDALDLASRILASCRTRPAIASCLVNQLMLTPPENKKENYARIRSVLTQKPTLEEFQFWAHWDQSTANSCGKWPWLYRLILERFEEATVGGSSLDADELRKQFAPFIERRHDFPWQIPCAALEAILKLDERNAPPLQDTDWQQEL
jgi:hypothetical protein